MKRLFKILGRLLIFIVIAIAILFAVLCSSRVQTQIANKVTDVLSNIFDNEMQIGSVAFNPFNRLSIKSIYIEDLNQDTLLYVPELKAKFNLFQLLDNNISIREVILVEPYINLSTDITGTNNYQFLLDKFDSDTTKKGSFDMSIEVNEAIISNGRIAYHKIDAPLYNDNIFHTDRFLFSDINLRVALNQFKRGDIDAEIIHFSVRERSGFELGNFQAHLKLDTIQLFMPTLRVELPHSLIDVSVLKASMPQRDSIDIEQSIADATVDFILDNGKFVLGDIGAFIPAVRNVNKPFDISAKVKGTVGDVQLSNLSLSYDNYQLLHGTVSLIGLPNTHEAYFKANANKISVNAAIAQDFLSDMYNKPYVLPEMAQRVGELQYRGTLQGRFDNIQLNGGFTSAVGDITTTGSLQRILRNELTHKRDFLFAGAIETQDFQLGKLLGQENMGNISLKIDASGKIDTLKRIDADIEGLVSQFEYNNYAYNSLTINGHYNGHSFSGSLNMHDPHLWFDFDGLADWRHEDPRYNFNLNISSFHPGELRLVKGKYEDIQLKVNADINLTGNSLDNLNGSATLEDLYFYNDNSDIFIPDIRLTSRINYYDEPDRLQLRSDYINIDVNGSYNYSSLPTTIKKFLINYMPNIFGEADKRAIAAQKTNNSLTLDIYTHNLPRLTQIMDLKVQAIDDISIKGKIDEEKNVIELAGAIPGLDINEKTQLRRMAFSIDNNSDAINVVLSVKKLHNPKKPASVNMGDLTAYLQIFAKNDSILTSLRFNNDSIRQTTRGMVQVMTLLDSYNNNPKIHAEIIPTQLTLLDIPWQLNNSSVVYTVSDKTIDVNDFRLFTIWKDEKGVPLQHIFANGRGSTNVSDSIGFDLKDIELGWLVGLSGFYGIDFDGRITGGGAVYNIMDQLMLNADVNMKDFGMNSVHIGHAHAQAEWLHDVPALHYFGDVYHDDDNHHLAHLDGQFKPKQKTWNLGIDSEGVPLDFVTMWIEKIFGSLSGQAFGHVEIKGDTLGANVSANALVKNGRLGVDVIGMNYYFEDTVKLTACHEVDSILFRNIRFHDIDNNPVYVNGHLAHENFQNFRYDFNMSCTDAQVINLPRSNGNVMYGKVYATGDVVLKGNQRTASIDIKALTRPHSRLGISLKKASTAVDNDYITFVEDTSQPTSLSTVATKKAQRSFRMRLGLNVDVTPDVVVTLDIDQRTGDAIQARGDGNINLSYQTPGGDMNMHGQLNIASGSVSYTLTNILRKEFKVEQGSMVVFNGSPMNTRLNVRAYYPTTASLRDLLGDQFTQAGLNRSYVPVNCIIDIGGMLNNPEIRYDIELPNSDETARQQVQSIINTDEMKMRQLLNLLAFNKFYTPDYLSSSDNNAGMAESLSLLTSTVTGQLNNWINKVTNDFQLGFNVHTSGAGDNISQEYEGQFMYQPNNRLEINGNFGYRSNDISNRPFFGDIDIEYLLTESGKYRIKGYTHSVDKYSLKQASTIQGVGFVYKENFDTFSELFNIKPKGQKNKVDTVAVVPTDSVQPMPTDSIQPVQNDSVQPVSTDSIQSQPSDQ